MKEKSERRERERNVLTESSLTYSIESSVTLSLSPTLPLWFKQTLTIDLSYTVATENPWVEFNEWREYKEKGAREGEVKNI